MLTKTVPGVILFFAPILLHAAPPPDAELTQTITALDKALFDAYNNCELAKFASLVADDVEFYHDNDGFSRGKEHLTNALKQNICGKVRRELVPGSLQIYPLRNFGAVEIGVHRFHHPGVAPEKDQVGEAKFIHLWQFQNGTWKITRVISYDHGAAPK